MCPLFLISFLTLMRRCSISEPWSQRSSASSAEKRDASLVRELDSLFLGSDGGLSLCVFYGYRFGGDEDVWWHARNNDLRDGQERVGRQILDDAVPGAAAGSSEAARCWMPAVHVDRQFADGAEAPVRTRRIVDLFERRFSPDDVKHHKPSRVRHTPMSRNNSELGRRGYV
jgi:hypothetical protein